MKCPKCESEMEARLIDGTTVSRFMLTSPMVAHLVCGNCGHEEKVDGEKR